MGRKIFEQQTNNNPDVTKRIAFGKADAISENMELANLLVWLKNNLGALIASNNLSDIGNPVEVRGNLDVPSNDDLTNALSGLAELLDPGSGKVLGINNTVDFTINSPFQPVHKSYADSVKEQTESIAVSLTGNDTDFNNEELTCRKLGNVYLLSGTCRCQNSKTSPVLLCTISNYTNDIQVPFIGSPSNTSLSESAYGYIDTNGKVYFQPGKGDNQKWNINAPAMKL